MSQVGVHRGQKSSSWAEMGTSVSPCHQRRQRVRHENGEHERHHHTLQPMQGSRGEDAGYNNQAPGAYTRPLLSST
jgi:hypothetical protein